MKRKFIFFINPVSGTKNKTGLIKYIEKRMQQEDYSFQFLETTKDGNYHFLPTIIAEQKITDIIICGGDGTVNQIAGHLRGADIQVGIIPMGSGNGLAFTAGISKNLPKAMDVIMNGKASYIDSFFINNKFSCMLCGIGFDAKVAHEFAKQKTRGLATYARQTVKHFIKALPYHFTISINDKKIQANAFFISIANSNQFGNHVTIAPQASLSDGLLDIVIVNKMSKLNLVYALLRHIRFGKLQRLSEKGFEKKGIQYLQAKKVNIYNPFLAPLHIDGESAETAANFDIEIVPQAFKLIQPFK